MVDEVFQPLNFEAPIHTLQTKVETYDRSVSLINGWYKLESVVENGTKPGKICNSDLTQTDHPFNLEHQQTWYSSAKQNGSTMTYWNGSLSLKAGRTLSPQECSNYRVTVGFYTNTSIDETNANSSIIYQSCDGVSHDGLYLIDPFGNRDNETAFWTRCRNGFTEITQDIAKKKLNATLTAYGSTKDSGFIDGRRPYTVSLAEREEGNHYAHYDISIPFRYTEFYLEEFHIRSTSYLSNGIDTSDIRVYSDLFYCQWEPRIDRHFREGDFAMGSPMEEGPVTSYGRFQSVHSNNGTYRFVGNGIVFHVHQSDTFRLLWGEDGLQNEGWTWWSGSIWVRKQPPRNSIFRRCELVPQDGIYLIDPIGDGPSTTFRTRCVNGFMEVTQRIAKDIFNATLRGNGAVVDSGFIDGRRPFTVGKGSHYAHYDIPIPLGYTHFFLENFNIRSTSYKAEGAATGETSEIYQDKYYISWSQAALWDGWLGGDFAFGSPTEEGPTSSFGRYQGIESHDGIYMFDGNDEGFDVSASDIFRLHWGEGGGQHEGWAWWQGSIWIKDASVNLTVYQSCGEVPHDGTYLIDPFNTNSGRGEPNLIDPLGKSPDTAFWTRCKNGFTEISSTVARTTLNATLTAEGDINHAGFISASAPYTVGGEDGHYAYYDIPIPFGYTEFYLEDFDIGATSFILGNVNKDSSEIGIQDTVSPIYTRWNQEGLLRVDGSCCVGDFAFGSPVEDGPSTSYARYQSVVSYNDTHRFAGSDNIFRVPYSTTFRLHWGEAGGQAEGWAWRGGSIWVRHSKKRERKNSSLKVNSHTCSYNVQVHSCPNYSLSNGYGRQSQKCAGEENQACTTGQRRSMSLSQSQCHVCDGGQVPNAERTKCILCPAGTYSQRGFSECQLCDQYEVQPYSGQEKCKRLKAQVPSRTVR